LLPGCSKGGASAGAESPSGEGEESGLVGGPAPDFELAAENGKKPASLSAAKGKVVLVDFWATWCAPCKASFPKWEALSKKYSGDLVVIGISEDDEKDGIDAFVKETGATFAIGWDGDKGVAGAYKPGTMPTAFLVDRNGLVRYVHSGFRAGDEKLIAAKVKSLLE
jgi:cytochrome c biogenesis protein CcmG/thiol:disulfide interchange protein DsbE